MIERIRQLADLTMRGQMYVKPVKTAFDPADDRLPREERESKQLCAFILNQQPKLTPYSAMTGFFRCDSSVVGDAFNRMGHRFTSAAMSRYYLKPIDNLSTMEWQHATADYSKVLSRGIRGIIEDIDTAAQTHTAPPEQAFLRAERRVAETLILWAHRCAALTAVYAETVDNDETRTRLNTLSAALGRVPEQPPQTFYEAVLTVYVCFSADPDSFGTLDRYLTPFYRRDIQSGCLTREEAKAYLQEFLLLAQAVTPPDSPNFTRGGQSHFCVGGYLPSGEDGFNEVSELIVESLMELPTYIPEITLRRTDKTPREVLRYMMDCERHDPYKRIAFTNDEKRVKCFTEVCGFPYERAVSYTMVGCNEPAFCGAITGSNSKGNVLKCVETLFHRRADEVKAATSFDAFYALFERELFADLTRIFEYDDFYNGERAKDINYLSSLFFKDCVENARSLTQGGGNTVIAAPMLIGIANVIDSLVTVKQFVFDEPAVSMAQLIEALQANWQGWEDLHRLIRKTGTFFGNDDPRSNALAQRLYNSLYTFMHGKTNLFGYPWLVGDLLGYNEHHKWFGEKTLATPDGRHAGDPLQFGLEPRAGQNSAGLTALLNAVAGVDPHAIACGSTVTNVALDESLVQRDESFEKLVDLFDGYFKAGGVHFQLTYVSKEQLLAARENPDEYRHLRVRVTGFSDYFVRLKDSIQQNIIDRTVHTR